MRSFDENWWNFPSTGNEDVSKLEKKRFYGWKEKVERGEATIIHFIAWQSNE